MLELLKSFGFLSLRDFLAAYGVADLPDIVDRVYVRASRTPVVSSFKSTQKDVELISKAVRTLLIKNRDNHLCAGYKWWSPGLPGASTKIICYFPNSSSRILRSHEWSWLMRSIGDELAFFILTECLVIQMLNSGYVFLAGDFKSLSGMATERVSNAIGRNVLFYKETRRISFCSLSAFEYVFEAHNSEKYKVIQKDARDVLESIERRWKKISTHAIFKSFFKDELAIEDKSSALECGVKQSKLVNFLFLISKKLFKDAFDLHGFRILKSRLSLLIHRNRYETVSKNELVKYFRISRFKFFRTLRCTRSEFVFRFRVSSRFLVYITEKLIIPIISKYFYCTETSFSKFKVHYFPRSIWRHFSSIHIDRFLEKFEPAKGSTTHSYSELRCIPKMNGARIISNMSKARNGRPSINKSIYPEFCVLRHETHGMLGNSILNHSGMYEKLSSYLSRSVRPLYILKVDLSGCFDNIPQDEVVSLVRRLLHKSRYHTKSFSILEEVGGELRSRYVCKVTENAETINELMMEPGAFVNKVVKENASQRILSREEVEGAMTNMIKRNYVKHNGKLFVQKTGIAQGSVASTLLCSLYYKSIDDLYFDRVFKEGILTRYVDDFLVISPCIDEIMKFLEVSQSISHLGINFSKEKMESNFGLEEHLKAASSISELSKHKHSMKITNAPVGWCGTKIYSDGFSIKSQTADPYLPFSIAHSSTKPGRALESRMRKLLQNRMSRIYIDPNNKKAYENIYDTFLFYGKKLGLLLGRMDFINRSFARRTLEHSKRFAFRICRKHGISITRKKIEDIASRAFDQSGVSRIVLTP
ncbi:TELOMERASE REVERSE TRANSCRIPTASE [Encephalitozoon cuniculi GB-M1]|uniref:Telomerase reverse transcriptase n=2 Tax=Encephalitozoon cuniculi TaxID=6035 RepID=Q8SQQ0_ENCCU|nr:telomerase reverse transcriptase [Encephalitozoon cuniculi GB-M1]KMV65510.1 telomerase reverse transcriptase [Encephalitozoon cuniculi EcunIII-L]UYI26709.1 telomerase reverse transcriptase [Encephalitozoon cuniculi]CAD27002.2 TELOMERASE REVERSE TRANSCRIPTASE [Encephalitozoon cuniculi GB-M1]